jgi:hypothetical protein
VFLRILVCTRIFLVFHLFMVSCNGFYVQTFFFEIKVRSTAISFKKKAVVHHKPKRTPPPQIQHTQQRTQQNTTPPQLGREARSCHHELRRRHQRCATPTNAARSKPKRQLELLHHGPINLKPHKKGRRSPCSNKASA